MIINANQGGGGNLQEKTATPSTAQQVITPDSQYDGLSKVTIAPTPLEMITVKSSTAQQPPITPTSPNIGFSSITVEPNLLQTKSVTLPTSQPIQPDAGYYGLSGVNVSAPLYPLRVTPTSTEQTFNIPSGYYGHGVVTVPGITTTIPATAHTNGQYTSRLTVNNFPHDMLISAFSLATNGHPMQFSNIRRYSFMNLNGLIPTPSQTTTVDISGMATDNYIGYYISDTGSVNLERDLLQFLKQLIFDRLNNTLTLVLYESGNNPLFYADSNNPYIMTFFGANITK